MLDRATLRPYTGVALLTVGSIATLYGAYLLRGAFGTPFGNLTGFPMVNGLLNTLPVFLLLCLPFVALYSLLELRGYALTKWVGLTPNAAVAPLASGALFGVLGIFWLFTRAGNLDRQLAKTAALVKPEVPAFRAPGRESMETLVFVVVLVLVLQLFVVQAFVIPTGSMAETLYGYRKHITCSECGYQFEVNCTDEVEPQSRNGRDPKKDPTVGYCCPNCRYLNRTEAEQVKPESGDRLLVSKLMGVERGRVVVFKYPDAAQTSQTPQNYIKRLVGMPGETVAIYNGDLYVTKALDYPADAKGPDGQPLYPRPDDPKNLWRAPLSSNSGLPHWTGPDYGYASAQEALDRFAADRAAGFPNTGGFQVVRKPDDLVLEMRRIVYSNDHQPTAAAAKDNPRWKGDGGWAAAGTGFEHTGGGFGWVRYTHRVPPAGGGWEKNGTSPNLEPRKITNFQGYNGGIQRDQGAAHIDGSDHWAGDLLLECTADFTDPAAALVLELSRGEFRHRAEFANGKVRLTRFKTVEGYTREDGNKSTRQVPTLPAPNTGEHALVEAATGFTGGSHKLRFANVDCRLRVWVDDKPLDFGGKSDFDPPPPPEVSERDGKNTEGWTQANDIDQPAGVGAGGGVKVSRLELWRDTHYLLHTNSGRSPLPDTERFVPRDGPVQTYYVHPGHYLCMGDNSAQSSDGRTWGLVPERLMLGRAVFIFFPFDRVGFIK